MVKGGQEEMAGPAVIHYIMVESFVAENGGGKRLVVLQFCRQTIGMEVWLYDCCFEFTDRDLLPIAFLYQVLSTNTFVAELFGKDSSELDPEALASTRYAYYSHTTLTANEWRDSER
jgi:hypothetical protein